ncbi:hypothetical protein EDC01DRAFT_779503 [Geopyxis carbonaria]|nr:hypothetical protein EDC01DRAFT_779503 [Geopyxis carbonaria]
MTVSVSNSYALLTGLAFSTILQPRGSLLFPYSHSYFWRLSPILSTLEAAILLPLLFIHSPRAIMRARASAPSDGPPSLSYQLLSALPVLFMVTKTMGTRGSAATAVLGALYGFSWGVVQTLSYLSAASYTRANSANAEAETARRLRQRFVIGSTRFGEWAGPVSGGPVFYAALIYAGLTAAVCGMLGFFQPWRGQVLATLTGLLVATAAAAVVLSVVGVVVAGKRGSGGSAVRYGLARFFGNADFWGVAMFLAGSGLFVRTYREADTSRAAWIEWLPG